MTLVRICGQHRRAVERDLIELRFTGWEDLGTDRLSIWKLASIVLASPPGSAVYHAETRYGVMTPEQQMMAQSLGYTLQGQEPEQPNAVPVQEDSLESYATAVIGNQAVLLEAMPPDELKRRREEVASKIRENRTRDKVHTEKYDPFAAAKRARAERLKQLGTQQFTPPPLPAHIAGEIEGPPLPAHIRGVS